jgi:hypothetical protein
MNDHVSASMVVAENLDELTVAFGTSADGFPVALVGDNAFAMLPGRGISHILATGWRITRPIAEWRRSDFYGHSGRLADEAEFRAKVLENAEHQREKRRLGRVQMRSSANTPWGAAQGATAYAEGIVEYATASHGGFHLSPVRNAAVHPTLRSEGGWYEEDCDWAAVAITFPDLFTGFERRCAETTLKDWFPDAWEAIFEAILGPGDSYQKDRRAFAAAHAADWVVISAIRASHHAPMVEVVATLGGRRDPRAEERRFLVPSTEYEVDRSFGFVVDPARHAACDGVCDAARDGVASFVGRSIEGRGP